MVGRRSLMKRVLVVGMGLILLICLSLPAQAGSFDIDFGVFGEGDFLLVNTVANNLSLSSVDASGDTFWGERTDVLQMAGAYVVCMEYADYFTVNRMVATIDGFSGFFQSYEGRGSYGTYVGSNGIGVLWGWGLDTGAFADSAYLISEYASNYVPATSVIVTQANIDPSQQGIGLSQMSVDWSDIVSPPVEKPEFDEVEPIVGEATLYLLSDYGFGVDIWLFWTTPAIHIEMFEELSG